MTSVSILSSGCEAGAEGDVASMVDDDLVCGCNGYQKAQSSMRLKRTD